MTVDLATEMMEATGKPVQTREVLETMQARGLPIPDKNVINVISTGVVPTDPMTLVGKTLPKVTGVLRPVNIGSFNVWIIYPRSSADLVLQ